MAPCVLVISIAAAATLRRPHLGATRRWRYICLMEYAFPIVILIAMLAVLGTLLLGVINMARGGNPRRSNRLMQQRVLLQGLALLLFVIFMLLYRR
jgi:hypoxia induced protein